MDTGHCKQVQRLVPAGFLRLGAFWRQQSSLLHDPQPKLHDELVTRPLLFLTANMGPHPERDGLTGGLCVFVCVCGRRQ